MQVTPRFYLAGPFFNPVQVQLIEDLERIFDKVSIPYFSPRKQDQGKKNGPLTDEDATRIFKRNYEELQDCSAILAVVDWLLPPNQYVFLAQSTEPITAGKPITPLGAAMNIPDSGTVWELGAAYVEGLKILLYTERPAEAPLNVMLSQCANGVVHGPAELIEFLKGCCDWNLAPKWQGRNQ